MTQIAIVATGTITIETLPGTTGTVTVRSEVNNEGGGSMTGAEIKTAYEGEPDTNAFSDADRDKLAGIEDGATAGGGGSSLLAVSGRWYAEIDLRWVCPNVEYGMFNSNHYNNAGTGVDPVVPVLSSGWIVKAGDTIDRVRLNTHRNNNGITGVKAALAFIAKADDAVSSLWKVTGLPVEAHNGSASSFSDFDPGPITIAEDGMLIPCIAPEGTLSSRKYLYATWSVIGQFSA